MDNNQGSFFDRNTLLAVGLTLVVWVGWSKYMETKYPKMGESIVKNDTVVNKDGQKQVVSEMLGENADAAKLEASTIAAASDKAAELGPEIQRISFEFENLSFDVVSTGMGLSNIKLLKYTDRDNEFITISDGSDDYPSFASKIKSNEGFLPFKLQKLSETVIIGLYSANGITVEKKFDIDPINYQIMTSLSVSGDQSLPRFQTLLAEKAKAPAEVSLLSPTAEKQEFIVKHREGFDRNVFNNEEPFTGDFTESYFMAVSSHYFAMAIINKSDLVPNFSSNYDKDKQVNFGYLTYPSFAGTKKLNLTYTSFVGPKDLDLLRRVDPVMPEIVDLGWFSFLAVPLLDLLKWFYSIFGNWGFAIIGLTILVRLVVMPFNIMSYKSMKKMQEIQPALKSIREKHKDDQVRMNQEVMGVMSQNKVNPLGGCLPMLLQFPVFIALYRVLSESIDLYKAPFAFWIADLSLKDPFYVLPILMGISMFVQQKITPNTMDPAQQKVMMIMPVMFSFFMISLPSGLTLYIFVSTLFGIIQQQLFMNKPQEV